MKHGVPNNDSVLTQNQNNLRLCELKLGTLRLDYPNSAETLRHEAIRAEILSRMDEAEKISFEKLMSVELTASEKRALAERERIAMESNKDSNSI